MHFYVTRSNGDLEDMSTTSRDRDALGIVVFDPFRPGIGSRSQMHKYKSRDNVDAESF